jgi:hypothetical protein
MQSYLITSNNVVFRSVELICGFGWAGYPSRNKIRRATLNWGAHVLVWVAISIAMTLSGHNCNYAKNNKL